MSLNGKSYRACLWPTGQYSYALPDDIFDSRHHPSIVYFCCAGIDISTSSLEHQKKLIKKHKIKNLTLICDDFRNVKLSEKFNYIIDEGGGNLSVGEKQRIGIARALYKNPELIILDEPTSALDSDTAKNLIKFLGELRKRRTLIIISHDLNTLQFCNKIYEIKQSEAGKNKIILKDGLN